MAITPAQLGFLKGQKESYDWALRGTAEDERERGTIFCQRDEGIMHLGKVKGYIGAFPDYPKCPEGWREVGNFHTHRGIADFPTYGDLFEHLERNYDFTCIGTPAHWKVDCFYLDKGALGYGVWESRIKKIAEEAWEAHRKLPTELMVEEWEKVKQKVPIELYEKIEDLTYKYFDEFMRGRRMGYIKHERVFGVG